MLLRIETEVVDPVTRIPIPEDSFTSLSLIGIGICIAMLVYCLVQLLLTFKDP